MWALSDLIFGVIGAILAWGVYHYTGHPGWVLLSLAAFTVLFLWLRTRRDEGK